MSLQYKGINLSGLEFGSGYQPWHNYVPPGEEHYEYWGQDVGANIVRIPFTWERLQREEGGALDQQYLNFLKDAVNYATSNGMTAILDLHNYANYHGQRLSESEALADVWTKLGKEFNGNDSVWLNLMNEPNNISAQSWADITQDVVYAMRGEGIDNKLLLSGTAWSGAHSWISSGNAQAYENFVDPLENYAFDVHQYLDTYSTGTHGQAAQGIGATSLVAITQWAEANGHQLFLGEIGAANPNISGQEHALSELENLFTYMEAHSEAWLGWTLWGAGPWWGNSYHFNINPQNITSETPVDNQIIQNILDWFSTPGGNNASHNINHPSNSDPVPAHDIYSFDISAYRPGNQANDVLYGGAGDDVLYGGIGADLITGGGGKNTFLYGSILEGGDKITDFKAGSGGDILNISNLLESYDPLNDDINNFIKLVERNNSTTVAIDIDGNGDNYASLATLKGVHGLSVEGMIDDGNIVINQTVIL